MKRGREEEGAAEEQEQEQEQEEAPPAPMAASPARIPAASPARIPGPAAATPSPARQPVVNSHGQVLTWDDAVNFVLSVRAAFDRAKYHEFLRVISQIDSIGVSGIVDRMEVLLRGQPELQRQFNMFVPEQYELTLDNDDEHEEAPVADAQRD